MIRPAPRPDAPAAPARLAVRDAGTDDLDAVMTIMASAFDPSFGEAWTRSQCSGILPMAGVGLRLATDAKGAAAGFALLRIIAGEAELLLIAVRPSARHSGVGRALLDDFIALARAAGAHRLHLEVRDGNEAIILYERAGFTLVGRRRDYYRGADGAAHDALTLALDL